MATAATATPTAAPSAPGSDAGFEDHGNWIRVRFSSEPDDAADFHYLWLRHNCDEDRHPVTRERVVCSSDLPLHPRPREIWVDSSPEVLKITWAEEDGAQSSRTSTYTFEWLRQHAYSYGQPLPTPPPSDPTVLKLDASKLTLEQLSQQVVDVVDKYGVAVVENYGLDTETLIDSLAAGRGLQIRATHFGRIEDLRTDNTTNQNTDQLGYTDYPVRLHTDQPFLENPPQYQLLQCMQPAEEGGENYLVDALAAANYLKATDAHAFKLLTTVPVAFHRKQKNFESLKSAPILQFDEAGNFVVRYSYFTMAPYKLPFAEMEEWYRAYNAFADVTNKPAHQYHVPLKQGDFVMYNNHQMLHARHGFKGARWMRGIYFDSVAKPADSEPATA